MKFRHMLLAATAAVALPGAAMAQSSWLPTAAAQPISGVYLGAGAGWNHLDKNNLTAIGTNALALDSIGASRQGNINFKEGGVGVLSLGYGFGNGFRVEVEGNYRYNEVDKLGGFPARAPGAGFGSAFRNFDGQQKQYGAMANVYYDFQLPQWFPNMPVAVVPYIGGGVGYMWKDVDARGTRRDAPNTIVSIDDTTGAFAYQGIAGLSFPIASVPGLAITAEYRYTGSLQSKFDGVVTTPAGGVSRGQYQLDQNHNHSALIGVRYAFNTPVPVAPAPVAPIAPAVAPAPARTYLVFFDWDRADLTARARQIIAEAAQAASRVQATRIEVSGHTDSSGSPQYNQRLSQRRADAVAAELVRLGVQRSEITIRAYGESQPLVATADGVREPQNRRVEIVLR
ncbi:OmpA family protein [Roseomonas marmotae]|uniref:OmpA family protein n=1 Tax=Roseomonas marmotae TaxID=2768161 RepID=A0ABS3KGX6_9PROT|nr:OmpA family protein [Roseomonas marmotae]MBO1076733.1 OmpA family protein [Roseomonas marmotae]QTI77977.1 OmpA family protein [Roseomonas marmotae]